MSPTLTLSTLRSKEQLIAHLWMKLHDAGYPPSMMQQMIRPLQNGDVVTLGPRKFNMLVESLDLTTSERHEFNYHFIGGD